MNFFKEIKDREEINLFSQLATTKPTSGPTPVPPSPPGVSSFNRNINTNSIYFGDWINLDAVSAYDYLMNASQSIPVTTEFCPIINRYNSKCTNTGYTIYGDCNKYNCGFNDPSSCATGPIMEPPLDLTFCPGAIEHCDCTGANNLKQEGVVKAQDGDAYLHSDTTFNGSNTQDVFRQVATTYKTLMPYTIDFGTGDVGDPRATPKRSDGDGYNYGGWGYSPNCPNLDGSGTIAGNCQGCCSVGWTADEITAALKTSAGTKSLISLDIEGLSDSSNSVESTINNDASQNNYFSLENSLQTKKDKKKSGRSAYYARIADENYFESTLKKDPAIPGKGSKYGDLWKRFLDNGVARAIEQFLINNPNCDLMFTTLGDNPFQIKLDEIASYFNNQNLSQRLHIQYMWYAKMCDSTWIIPGLNNNNLHDLQQTKGSVHIGLSLYSGKLGKQYSNPYGSIQRDISYCWSYISPVITGKAPKTDGGLGGIWFWGKK